MCDHHRPPRPEAVLLVVLIVGVALFLAPRQPRRATTTPDGTAAVTTRG